MSSCGAVAFDLTRLRTYLGDMHELQKVGPCGPAQCGERTGPARARGRPREAFAFLTSLDLSYNQLCGVDIWGETKLARRFDASLHDFTATSCEW